MVAKPRSQGPPSHAGRLLNRCCGHLESDLRGETSGVLLSECLTVPSWEKSHTLEEQVRGDRDLAFLSQFLEGDGDGQQ